MKKLVPFVFIFLVSLKSFGQLFDLEKEKETKDWGLTITPYALLAAQATDVGDERLRQSFSDLSSLTNSGFQLATNLYYKRFYLRFDGTWANLGTEQRGDLLDLDLNIDQRIFDIRAGYLVAQNLKVSNNDVIQGWHLGVNVGAKYWLNAVNLGYQLKLFDVVVDEGELIQNQEWWDLTVGIAPSFFVSKTVTISAQASIGGFGIGNSSKIAYDWTFLNSFKVTKALAIHAGFRNFYYNREDGEGADLVNTKVNVIGPFLGASLLVF
ncbi:hypothetical protein [Algoriphagus namhaensis]